MFVYKHSDDVNGVIELMPTMAGSLTCMVKYASIFYHFKKVRNLYH